jgi:hypothetical protein
MSRESAQGMVFCMHFEKHAFNVMMNELFLALAVVCVGSFEALSKMCPSIAPYEVCIFALSALSMLSFNSVLCMSSVSALCKLCLSSA